MSLSLSLSRLFLSSVITRASGASLSVLGEEDGPAAEGEIGDGCRRGDGEERRQKEQTATYIYIHMYGTIWDFYGIYGILWDWQHG